MNIDVEGHEEKVLEGFDIKKYNPKIISIEYLDLKMKTICIWSSKMWPFQASFSVQSESPRRSRGTMT